jgi:hypothetical protein
MSESKIFEKGLFLIDVEHAIGYNAKRATEMYFSKSGNNNFHYCCNRLCLCEGQKEKLRDMLIEVGQWRNDKFEVYNCMGANMTYLKKLMDVDKSDPTDIAIHSALQEMIGSKIVNAGFMGGILEGGMTFDFEKDGVVTRIVFGYNELGEWIEFKGEIKSIERE